MAKISNTALSDTFDTWRLRTNQIADRLSQFAVVNSSLYANTLIANVQFTSKGGASFQKSANIAHNLRVTANTTLGTNPQSVHRLSGRVDLNNKLVVTGNVNVTNVASVSTFVGTLSVTRTAFALGNTAFGSGVTDVHRHAGRSDFSGAIRATSNITQTNTSSTVSFAAANVNFTGTGEFLVKTANVDIRGGSLLVTSNTRFTAANVSFTGAGELLLRKANTDIRGGTLLITSNTKLTGAAGLTFPDGTSQTTAASASGLQVNSVVKTAAFIANSGFIYLIRTTTAAFTTTVNASISVGAQFGYIDVANTFASNNFTVNPNGLKINGSTTNFVENVNMLGLTIWTYTGTGYGWR